MCWGWGVQYSKEKDLEWLKDMKETDKELLQALKDKKWVEEVKANLKNKPEQVYIPKKDPKGELDFVSSPSPFQQDCPATGGCQP